MTRTTALTTVCVLAAVGCIFTGFVSADLPGTAVYPTHIVKLKDSVQHDAVNLTASMSLTRIVLHAPLTFYQQNLSQRPFSVGTIISFRATQIPTIMGTQERPV